MLSLDLDKCLQDNLSLASSPKIIKGAFIDSTIESTRLLQIVLYHSRQYLYSQRAESSHVRKKGRQPNYITCASSENIRPIFSMIQRFIFLALYGYSRVFDKKFKSIDNLSASLKSESHIQDIFKT